MDFGLDADTLLIASSVLTLLEAFYLIGANLRRVEQVASGFLLGFAALLTFSVAGHINPDGIAGGIADWLFAFSAPLVPFSWLVLSSWWGRDVAAERKLSTQTVGLFFAFVVSLLFTVSLSADPPLTYIPEGESGSHFEMTSISSLMTLFTLIATLFGLYNVENTIRSAVGSQRQKLSFGFTVLLITSGLALFMGSVELLYEQVPLWSVLICALSLPVAGLAFMLSLRYYDPAHLGIVVTRRLKQTSVVIIAGGAFVIVLGVIDALVENFGALPEIIMPTLAVILVGIFFVSVFALDLAQGRAIKDRPLEPMANSEVLREFVENVATSTSLEDIVSQIGSLLEHDHGINRFALLSAAETDSYLLMSAMQEPRVIPRNHVIPIAEWMHRYGLPISYEDFCERSSISEEHCRFCITAIGFTPTVIIPLVCRKQLVGLLLSGPAKDGHTDFRELLDFMEVVSAPLAMAIQSSRVTDELVASKELDSYYRVSESVLGDIRDSISLFERLHPVAAQRPSGSAPDSSSEGLVSAAIKRLRHLELRLSASPPPKWTISNVDINGVIREAIDISGVRTLERITVQEKFGPTCTVKADHKQLLFLFECLISNAIEAMPMSGSLVISTEQTASAEENPAVRIIITDTGVGMSPDFMEAKLFRPFSGTKNQGLGIGLFQSREIARQLDGSLRVESIPGRGTSVHVMLLT